ncbi:MAG: alpha/beta fold hydrolase [Hyphomicrobiaceae bacterium]
MAEAAKWTDTSIEIAGVKIHVTRAGKGHPLVVLHHDIGTLDRVPLFDTLAKSYDVIVPHYAGWGRSQRPEWMRSVRDVAVMQRALLDKLAVDKASLLGLGFGGWVAAEMATMSARDIASLVLVGPMGIKPAAKDAYILDQAIISYIDYPRAFFHDHKNFEALYGNITTDQLEAWDIAREMCFRIAWKPYMYSQTLPHLLSSIKSPVMIVWGDQDKVVPVSTAAQWQTALPGAKLEIIKGCGHAVDMEQPAVLAKLMAGFLK